MNRNLKIFLTSGIPAGAFMGILYTFLYGVRVGLISGFAAGSIFGVLMVFVIGFLHGWAVRKIAGGNPDDKMGVCHVRDIKLPLPFDKTFDLCLASIGSIDRCKVYKEDRFQGQIIARTGLNWKTWGDIVSFEINRIDDGYTHVRISSRPSARTTLVDFGKNLENIELISSFLKKAGTQND